MQHPNISPSVRPIRRRYCWWSANQSGGLLAPYPVRWKHLNISCCQPYQVSQWGLCGGQVRPGSYVLGSPANQNRGWSLPDQSAIRDLESPLDLCLMSASIINDGRYSLKPTILQQSKHKHIDDWPAFQLPLGIVRYRRSDKRFPPPRMFWRDQIAWQIIEMFLPLTYIYVFQIPTDSFETWDGVIKTWFSYNIDKINIEIHQKEKVIE